MSTAPRYLPHYRVTDYQQWQGDWELWDGVAVAMSPSPFGRHQAIAATLFRLLANQIEANECLATAFYEIDWIMRDDAVVRPDMVVICGAIPERHIESVPALVVEVMSDVTRSRDTTHKRALYHEQHVPYYDVIVDPDSETITVDALDATREYQTVEVTDTIKLGVCDNCEIEFKRSEVFRR